MINKIILILLHYFYKVTKYFLYKIEECNIMRTNLNSPNEKNKFLFANIFLFLHHVTLLSIFNCKSNNMIYNSHYMYILKFILHIFYNSINSMRI